MQVKAVWQTALEWVFPSVCLGCGRVGHVICPFCWAGVEPPHPKPPSIEGVEAVFCLASHRGVIREGLHALKYENLRHVAVPLGEALAPIIPVTFDALIPIPLHYARLQERGYNQANLLAQALASQVRRPVLADALVRRKATTSQVGLGAAARRDNLQDAFSASGLLPPSILLVDDVCTTGATLGAAALALRAAGVQTIYAATISLAD
jgi:ComF family protein